MLTAFFSGFFLKGFFWVFSYNFLGFFAKHFYWVFDVFFGFSLPTRAGPERFFGVFRPGHGLSQRFFWVFSKTYLFGYFQAGRAGRVFFTFSGTGLSEGPPRGPPKQPRMSPWLPPGTFFLRFRPTFFLSFHSSARLKWKTPKKPSQHMFF